MSKVQSKSRHDYWTPPEITGAILKFEKRECFDVDFAASVKNIPCHYIITPGMDALELCWRSTLKSLGQHANPIGFLNPPYGSYLKKFMKKAAAEAKKGARFWMLIPANVATNWAQDYILPSTPFVFLKRGRIHFISPDTGLPCTDTDHDSMIVYFGPDAKAKAKRWVKKPPLPGTMIARATG